MADYGSELIDYGREPQLRQTFAYRMRAYRALSNGYVFWESTNWPDFGGTKSGYNPVELSDISYRGKYPVSSFEPYLMASGATVDGVTQVFALPGVPFFPPPGVTVNFRAVLSVNDPTLTGTVKLYNASDNEFVSSILMETQSTIPVTLEATLSVGDAYGQVKEAQRVYEVWIETNGTLVGETTVLGTAYLCSDERIPGFNPVVTGCSIYRTMQRGAVPWTDGVGAWADRGPFGGFNPADYHNVDNTIGIDPGGGYTKQDRDSVSSGAEEEFDHTAPTVSTP